MRARMSTHRYVRLLSALMVTAALTASSAAQTKITAPENKYSVAQDVQLGQEASAEARKELPMLADDRVDDYVEQVGRRLVAAIPPEFRHSEFRYTFDVVNQKEINAFALPGGPMFLNRGMIEASKTEAEMAGVMAHEISHVALRHGTAQATKGQKFQIGAIAGQVLGAIVGGTAGSIIAQGSQFGLGAYFLKYGREYETQADILGSQIMARAGYDPRQMANMFKTIEAQGGRGGPEWLSSHPNPGNRYNAINREAQMLQVNGNAGSPAEFQSVKARLGGMSPALTQQQIAQGQGRNAPVGTAAALPCAWSRPRLSIARIRRRSSCAWRSLPTGARSAPAQGGVTYAPQGGYVQDNRGQTAFTHGVQFGVTQGGSGNLQRDTEALLQSFARSNPQLRRAGNYQSTNIGGSRGLTTSLRNVSEVTGEAEYVNLSTVYLRGRERAVHDWRRPAGRGQRLCECVREGPPEPAADSVVSSGSRLRASGSVTGRLKSGVRSPEPRQVVSAALRSRAPNRLHHDVEDRDEEDVQEGGEQHPAGDRRAHRMTALLPGAACKHQRHDAEDERQRRHQDRPQPDARGLDRRVHDRTALPAQLLGELDDQNRVLGGQPDQHHESDLTVEIVLQPAHPLRRQRAEYRQRYAQQHDERQHERLVLRCERQVDEQQADAEDCG